MHKPLRVVGKSRRTGRQSRSKVGLRLRPSQLATVEPWTPPGRTPREMARVADNSMRYNATLEMQRRRVGILNYSIMKMGEAG